MRQPLFKLIAISLCLFTLVPTSLFACDLRVRSLLGQLAPESGTSGLPVGDASYFDPDARTSRLDVLTLYWNGRAGCVEDELVATQDILQGPAYLAAAAMSRTGRIDAAGYSVLEAHHLEALSVPLLLAPENEIYLYKYAQREERNKNAFSPPLEEMYKLLHASGQYSRAVALVERNGPFTSDDVFIKFQLAWAYARLGKDRAAQALWRPLMKYREVRRVHANTLGSRGRFHEAWTLIAGSPAAERGMMMHEYLEVTGDFETVQEHAAWMSTCEKSRLAAMHRQYLRAMELADTGRCEKIFNYVPTARSHKLAQRYTTTHLYEVAAKKGDGLLFRHLARRGGALDGYGHIPTTPAILALVAEGRDEVAREVMQEDGPLEQVSTWTWGEVAYLARPGFSFGAWIDLYLHAKPVPSTDAPLVQLAQSFATQEPAAAIAWFERNSSRLLAWQKRQFIFGLVRGLLDAQYLGSKSEYRPVLHGYRPTSG
jgi:hypothetical protein